MQYTLDELKQSLGVELINELDIQIKGDAQSIIKGVCTIQNAQPEHIAFLVNPNYKKYLTATKASAVILGPQDAAECSVNAIVTRNPYFVYAKIAGMFETQTQQSAGIHPSAVIGQNCEIDPTAKIGAHCVIGNNVKIGAETCIGPNCFVGDDSSIGTRTCLNPNATIYNRTVIGSRVLIASGAVIGSDGFGMAKYKGAWHKVPQLGCVVIEDDVEVGSNTTIDRGAIEDTVIGQGVKLDNLIQIGHNVRIGDHTVVAGCVGISGSAVIGKNCIIGGDTAVAGHISIADNVVVTGGTHVSKSIREVGMYSSGVGGLMTNLEWRKNSARVNRLEHLIERVKELESKLNINSKNTNSEIEV